MSVVSRARKRTISLLWPGRATGGQIFKPFVLSHIWMKYRSINAHPTFADVCNLDLTLKTYNMFIRSMVAWRHSLRRVSLHWSYSRMSIFIPVSIIELPERNVKRSLTYPCPRGLFTGVKPLIVTAVTINPIWRTPKKEKSIVCFIYFFVALFKILSMEE